MASPFFSSGSLSSCGFSFHPCTCVCVCACTGIVQTCGSLQMLGFVSWPRYLPMSALCGLQCIMGKKLGLGSYLGLIKAYKDVAEQ